MESNILENSTHNYLRTTFVRRVRTSPDVPALIEPATGRTYSYSYLSHLVGALISEFGSQSLANHCVIVADMSIDTVVTYLAVVLSGRTAIMLDAEVSTGLSARLFTEFSDRCLYPKDLVHSVAAISSGDLVIDDDTPASDVEAVFMTSGTTGDQKFFGVPSERRLRDWVQPPMGETFGVLNVRRPTSTPFRLNVHRAIMAGGSFIAVDPLTMSLSEINSSLQSYSIHEISFTPTMARRLLPYLEGLWVQKVQRIHLNGERILASDVDQLLRKFPNGAVRTNYGLTEFGVISEGFIGQDRLGSLIDPISSGRPTIDIRIVDELFRDVRVGDVGSISVKGVQGYLGTLNPGSDFQFEKFAVDGWQETGDKGYIDERGELVVLGRWQETVKIRGTRLSLTDVESALIETGLVKAVLASVYSDSRGNDALGAVVVPHGDSEVSLSEIRRRITMDSHLVMCPTRIVVLREIPTLVTGKADRRRAQEILNSISNQVHSEQITSRQQLVSEILRTVLPGIEIGLNDDVFTFGVDSLAALEIVHALSETFAINLDVRVLLEHPTIAELSSAIDSYERPRERVIELSPHVENSSGTVYWILPGCNPYMATRLGKSIPGYCHKAVLNLGSIPGDVLLPTYESMVQALVRAIDSDLKSSEPFYICGFSSASYLASAVTIDLLEQGTPPSGLVVIDPPKYSLLAEEYRCKSLLPNPFHVMLGREGKIADMNPIQSDHALFGLQLYALANFDSRPVSVPSLVIAPTLQPEHELLWGQVRGSRFMSASLEHLEYLRRPQVTAPLMQSFLDWLTSLSK